MKKKIILFLLFIGFSYSVFGQDVTLEEIRNNYHYATLKMITKIYTRDSSNSAWFDRLKESGNPNIIIQRSTIIRDVIGAQLQNEYSYNTTFYNSQYNVVISLDVTLQFLEPIVLPEYVPYLLESNYDRRRFINEPSGSYTLREQAGAYRAKDGASLFIKSYESSCSRIY
jgi:hypothetical protein